MSQQVVVALALLTLFARAASAQAPAAATPPPTVVTSGEGIVQAVPDRAWITIAAESRASNPREAQKRNTDAMNPVLDKLKAAGVPADAVRTVGYELHHEWDYQNNRRVSRGYVARNTVEVRVDNVDRAAEYLEIAAGSGATALGGIRFDLKDRGKLEREALRMAVANARLKAEALAEGAGRSIDRVLRIDEMGVSAPPMPVRMMREAMQASAPGDIASAAPPISAGQMEIRAQVTFTAALK